MNNKIFKISSDYSGIKLCKFLQKMLEGFSFGNYQTMLRKGKIKVNSIRTKKDIILQESDEISIYWYSDISIDSQKNVNQFKLSSKIKFPSVQIIFENEDYIVINKPYGICSQLGTGLNYSILDVVKKQIKCDQLYLVHRLDKETTGVMIIAKKYHAARDLSESFANGKCDKTYIALCLKSSLYRIKEDSFKIDSPIIKDNKELPSVTNFTKLSEMQNNIILFKCNPMTGRYHQIRIHLSSIGCPIIGENKHINRETMLEMSKLNIKSKKLFLHANSININYQGKSIFFTAQIPEDFNSYIKLDHFENIAIMHKLSAK